MKANLNQLICIYKVNWKYVITYINTIDTDIDYNIYGRSDIQYWVTTSTRLILTPEADQSYDRVPVIFQILNTVQLYIISTAQQCIYTVAGSATMCG